MENMYDYKDLTKTEPQSCTKAFKISLGSQELNNANELDMGAMVGVLRMLALLDEQ